MLVLILIGYILSSIAISRLINNRNLGNPTLAWVPFARDYMLGLVADDVNAKLNKKNTSFCNILLSLSIASVVISILTTFWNESTIFLLISSVVSLIMYVVSIIMLNTIFKDYAKDNATAYTIISAIIPFSSTILLFIISEKNPISTQVNPFDVY